MINTICHFSTNYKQESSIKSIPSNAKQQKKNKQINPDDELTGH